MRIAALSLLFVFLACYLFFGGVFLIYEFYGPFAGLGSHHPTPHIIIPVLIFIFTGAVGVFYTLGAWGKPEKLGTVLQFMQKWSPLILLGLWIVVWVCFSGLMSTGNHRMIVDDKDPFGQSMGQSKITISFLSQLLAFGVTPLLVLSLSGVLEIFKHGIKSLYSLNILNVILGLSWFPLFIQVCASEPYYY